MVRRSVLGAPVDDLDFKQTLTAIQQLVASPGVHNVAGLNAAKIVDYVEGDSLFRDAIDESAIVSADGISMVWAAKLLGIQLRERVPGIDLMMALLPWLAERQIPTYFLGATPAVIEALVRADELRGLNIVGSRHGYDLDEAAWDQVVADISRSGAKVAFLGMTSPMKEHAYLRIREGSQSVVLLGVGGSFDVVAGKVKRAPKFLQAAGLEWLFRLSQEPRRLLGRYVVGNAKFLKLLVRHVAGR